MSSNASFDRVIDSLPQNISWDGVCERLGDVGYTTNDGVNNYTVYMSRQLLSLRGPRDQKVIQNHDLNTKILSALRWEDAIHVPLLQVDTGGVITDWNRSMSDLTGVSRASAVGKKYLDVLNERMTLSKEYKKAAVEWIATATAESQTDADGKGGSNKREEECRKDYIFPLPLPVRIPQAFNENDGSEYIELLASKLEHLSELYPRLKVPDGFVATPPCFTDSGWVGGVEFTLRKNKLLPSLQALCRQLVPQGLVNEDGSMRVAAASTTTKSVSNSFGDMGGDDANIIERMPAFSREVLSEEAKASYPAIAKYITTCSGTGLNYVREVIWCVRNAVRKGTVTKKVLTTFSGIWSTKKETSIIHQHIVRALGGWEIIAESVANDGKLVWHLAFRYEEKSGVERKQRRWKIMWTMFTEVFSPLIGENKHVVPNFNCTAIDTPFLVPCKVQSTRTMLTLKIEGIERRTPFDGTVRLKSWATVLVPATLNFFQLHRVVSQTMNAENCCTEDTCYQWRSSNLAVHGNSPISKEGKGWFWDYVQLSGGCHVKLFFEHEHQFRLFEEGSAVRQRISRTRAFLDQPMPLYSKGMLFDKRDNSVGKIHASVHSTCISTIFFRVGAEAILEIRGEGNDSAKYKVSCKIIDEFGGQMPQNPKINALQPLCLRGKPDNDLVPGWSVEKANAQLQKDRGLLRRKLCNLHSADCMLQMPWCETKDCDFKLYERTLDPQPVATDLLGLSIRPVFLHGQPPLPGSPRYAKYVSSIRGEPDNLVDWQGKLIGKEWELDVDSEMERIKSLPSATSGRGRKRKVRG